jgi:polyhydroxybutyrate depolymerase
MKKILPLIAAALLAACQSPSAKADDANLTKMTLEHDGEKRSYEVFVPPQHRDNLKGLVIALHGGLGTGEIMAGQTGFNAAATRHGFAVAYPDGIGRAWNAGTCCGKTAERKVDDVGFIAALVAKERARLKLSANQVFGTGFSNGAMLLHRIVCEAPGTLAAIAPVSGGPMFEKCEQPKAVPALFILGRDDKRIPWDGGVFDGTMRLSMANIVDQFASRNGCQAGATVVREDAGLNCQKRVGCKSDVEWCGLDKVGHQWPGGRTILPRLLGGNTERFNASEGIALFFEAQLAK